MYVAWRDLRHARGRFVLMTGVIALLSILVGFLSGLTGGLGYQNISGITSLPGTHVVMNSAGPGQSPTWSDSAVTENQARRWREADGVGSVAVLGVGQLRATARDVNAAVAVFGTDSTLGEISRPATGGAVLSVPAAAALHAGVGDTITISGRTFTVTAVSGDGWYSHTPIVYTSLADWQALAVAQGTYATALLVSGRPDWDAVATSTHTQVTTKLGSLSLLPAFSSEVGSLLMIVGMLFAISALVVGAFFTVWTIQRKSDIAILKALGASNRALRRDAMGQALVVLVVGIVIGLAVTTVAGLGIRGAMPFLLSPLTTVAPAVLMAVLGLAGAALAVRSISSAEPLTALGSNR